MIDAIVWHARYPTGWQCLTWQPTCVSRGPPVDLSWRPSACPYARIVALAVAPVVEGPARGT